ncbi:AAA family ATPase [Agrobacterium sp. B1(2019)]|uniref:trifunctional serine/threonine-protein kinase/ATP-binding protein/sensor histidine kinase n=1 Tax=Agrobacterium sp. B1(2019) TaxID=2607032 RepID=UPI0011EC8198|nr:AAA family ATPase [Agrobacterium sp. B1(2019)]TZG34269.1 AAA family ATPase [Agrobacterium sp. B1(2019)]
MSSVDCRDYLNPINGEVLWFDDDRVFYRVALQNGEPPSLVVFPSDRGIAHGYLQRLSREFQIRDQLDESWALRPRRFEAQSCLLSFDDHLCRPLSEYLQAQVGLTDFLRVAAAASRAIAAMHASGLIHKDIRPDNLLVCETFDDVRITGFGLASRLPRERRTTVPPEVIEGTLQYMAPEQTGRMNRSVDARSDLYSLGVSLYEFLTGALPFVAQDAVEWIHCHVARQPKSPKELRPDIPEAVEAILMKLMEKAAEARYQSATGLEKDLNRCLTDLLRGNSFEVFELGSGDVSAELLLPESLYGRQQEVQRLVTAFNEMAESGSSSLVLVSGYSGVGKTSVVRELERALVPFDGLFAAGKFDQYKRDIPYSIFAEAFQGLVQQLLGREEAELATWRDNLLGALGTNGELMVNLIPELEAIIGYQVPVPVLSGPEAHTRLMTVFRNFIGVFATKEHPLVLFLDDLQWLDLATLDLFTHISTREDLRHLMIIGAFRDNEVGPSHPLSHRLDLVRAAGRPFEEVRLSEISPADVSMMLSDLLETEPNKAARLSRIICSKVGGNPFFILQFIGAMADENLIYYDTNALEWRWDEDAISTKQISESVVDLMIARLNRLSGEALQALKLAACMGSSIDLERFHLVLGKGERDTQDLLKVALRMGLLIRVDGAYAFAHDRVQEAAYAMLSEDERLSAHREIASKLVALYGNDVEDQLFDVVDQFNRAAIPNDEPTRLLAASLNLRAGIKAKSASAYVGAIDYLSQGIAYLHDGWQTNYDLTFALAMQKAECTFLAGKLNEAGTLVEQLLHHAETTVHVATVYRLKVELHLVQSDNFAAVRSGLAALRLFDIDFPEHPNQSDVEREFESLSNALDGSPISSFSKLPAMTNPEMLAVMKILAEMWPPAFFTDFNLTTLVACRMVIISFQHGIAPSSNQGFAMLGWIMGPAFGRYDEGYHIVRLACDLAEKQKAPVDLARVYNTMSLTSSWTQSLSTSIEWYRTAYRAGVEAGDIFFSCFPCAFIAMTLLQRGRDLHQEAAELAELRERTRNTGYRDGADMALVPERASACLRGLTEHISDFSDAEFDQAAFEKDLGGARAPTVGWFYWTRKVMLHYLAGEFVSAVSVLDKVVTGTCKVVQIEHLDYHFYGALACAARIHEGGEVAGGDLRKRFDGFMHQLQLWLDQTRSPTFRGKHALVRAEAARLDGRDLEAQLLYEESIRLSQENEFLQDEAVAYEAAARFYLARGLERAGYLLLREARARFHKWGADAKVDLLDKEVLPSAGAVNGPASSSELSKSSASLEQLDLATVIKVLEAVSKENVLESLVDIVMKAAIEHSGAERAVLLFNTEVSRLRVMAEASTRHGDLSINQTDHDFSSFGLARSVVLYVARTGSAVVLDDASRRDLSKDDLYVRDNGLRSVLCVPLMNEGNGVGILYLENNLTPGAFTPERIAVLKFLASQAAASVEKARLIRDLKERESRIRRLVDSNIIGIFIWGRDGRLLDANDAFLRMTQYTREDLANGLAWYNMTPPDWQAEVEAELAELTATGALQPREKEYFRRDGTRVRVLIGAAAFSPPASEGVAYVLDLTQREVAERKAIESERRFRDLQSELAHASRVSTVGHLSTWIAHDIRQPLVGMVASANAGLQWLSSTPPNVEAAQRSLRRVEEEGHRASEILDKIRALIKKSVPVCELINVNELVLSTLALLQSEARHRAINIQMKLAEKAPLVSCDRVQLQQVIVNLVVNAIDAMSAAEGSEKRLTISTQIDKQGGVTTTVIDTGPSLPPKEYDRFFKAFYSTKKQGLGIGLAICKTIVESYGGRIWGEPCPPHGTSVGFWLPEATSGSSA